MQLTSNVLQTVDREKPHQRIDFLISSVHHSVFSDEPILNFILSQIIVIRHLKTFNENVKYYGSIKSIDTTLILLRTFIMYYDTRV